MTEKEMSDSEVIHHFLVNFPLNRSLREDVKNVHIRALKEGKPGSECPCRACCELRNDVAREYRLVIPGTRDK